MSNKADNARVAACEILHNVLTKDYFSNEAIDQSKRMKTLNSEERAFATALIYGSLNVRFALDAIIAQHSSRKLEEIDPLVLTILRMGVWQLCYSYAVPAFAAVDESVKLCRHFNKSSSSSFVNAILRSIDPENITWKTKDRGLALGLGNELFGLFKKWFGEEAANEIGEYYLRTHVDVSIRVNRTNTSPQELQKILEGEGAMVEPGRFFSHAFHLRLGKKRLDELNAFQEGRFMVQEEAAQAVGVVSSAESALIILDLCAAPGGKSCDLAERMPDSARLLALDSNERRLELARENAERLQLSMDFGVNDASSAEETSQLPLRFPYLSEGADLILLDVPCSGLGLLARKPELRWKMQYEDILRFPPLQLAMLNNAANLCKVGGEIIYSTCTLNPDENQHLLASFLASEAGQSWALIDIRSRIPRGLREVLEQNDYTAGLLKQGYILFRPDVTGGDGFFIAIIEKR